MIYIKWTENAWLAGLAFPPEIPRGRDIRLGRLPACPPAGSLPLLLASSLPTGRSDSLYQFHILTFVKTPTFLALKFSYTPLF